MTIREFEGHEEEHRATIPLTGRRVETVRIQRPIVASEEDAVTRSVRAALNGPVPLEAEMKMREALATFRARLEEHPYILGKKVRSIWPSLRERRSVVQVALAAAAAVLMIAGLSWMMPRVMGPAAVAGDVVAAGMGVGPVQLGMSAERVQAVWGKPGEATADRLRYFSRGVQVVMAAAGVGEISCHEAGTVPGPFSTFAGSTSDGLRIGSTEQDVLEKMGEPQFRKETDLGGTRGIAMRYRAGIELTVSAGPAAAQNGARVFMMRVLPAGSAIAQAMAIYQRGTAWGV